MKIAVVFPAAHRRGGVERVAWELLRHLGDRHEMWFVGGELASPDLLPPGIHHVAVTHRDCGKPRTFRRAATEALAALRVDRSVSLGANCPPCDIRIVGSVHRSWLRQGRSIPVGRLRVPAGFRYLMPRHRTLLSLERSYFSGPGGPVVVVSDVVGRDLSAFYGVDADSISRVPNGFSRIEFSAERRVRDRPGARVGMGIAEDQIAVLFVANELHRKGFGVLLDAIRRVNDPRLVLHVVGKADINDYRSTIARLGLHDRVRWHGPTNDVGRAFAAADLFVLPTQYEPFGIVVVEALAMGVPVITTRLAGAAAAIEGNDVGLLQNDPDDAAELAGLIRKALEPGVLERWGSNAPKAAEPYEWSDITRRLESLIAAGATR